MNGAINNRVMETPTSKTLWWGNTPLVGVATATPQFPIKVATENPIMHNLCRKYVHISPKSRALESFLASMAVLSEAVEIFIGQIVP